MAKQRDAVATGVAALYREIRSVLEQARASAFRAVNVAMVQAYWQVGRLIVEHEQGGRKRAAYGEAVLDDLSQRLTADFGRGFTATNLRHMRAFYGAFPIQHAPRAELVRGRKRGAARTESAVDEKPNQHATGAELKPIDLRPELSWTHYRLLLRVESRQARDWYMREAAEQNWSRRAVARRLCLKCAAFVRSIHI